MRAAARFPARGLLNAWREQRQASSGYGSGQQCHFSDRQQAASICTSGESSTVHGESSTVQRHGRAPSSDHQLGPLESDQS